MQRIGVLNGNSITYDHDISALVRGLTDWGVIEWGLISDNKVLAPIQAIVSAQRSNGQKLLLHFESDEQIQLPTSWSYKVYIEVDQSKIDDGQANAENGTGIATIKTGENLPSKNVLQIAKVTNGQIEQRTLIPKLQSLSTRTATLEEKVKTSETKVAKLEDKWTPQYLGKFVEVGEAYQAGDVMVEKSWRLTKEIYTQRINGVNNLEVRSNKHLLWELAIPQWATITILVKGMGNSWDRFAWRFSIEHKRTGGGLRPDIKYFDLPPKGQKSNGSVEYYEDQGTTLCFYVSGVSEQVYATIEGIEVTINRNSGLMKLYPREVKGVGERVECTIMGLHSNGDLIQPKPVEIVLGKEMSGTFTTIRDAPNSWYLELTYRTGSRQSQYWWINIWEVGLNTSEGNRSERIFVKKWPIVLKWWGREGYSINTYLKLEKFTSVM